MEYKYTKIDLEKWNRGKLFQSYIDDMRIVMSLTVDIDVTNLIKFSKSHDLKFYPAMIWVVSKVVNEHDEFKYSWDNKGNLIKWDYISPSYTEFVANQPLNFFDVSCLPWVKYNHFDVHVFDEGKFLAPVITWGKYELERERYIMPLTMNIHHAVADGFHLSRFFNEVQELINSIS
ncbi:CatA-like O-acetyltransferase [Clostridioides difficile]|nr:chloramphenicol acetyltransferase [Clostridioides difficile]